MESYKELIGSRRYKLATNTDINKQLQLEGKTKPLTEYDIIDIVNLQNLFEEERRRSTNYRFNGKLNIYTSNVLSTGATSSVWDPLFYGTPAVTPNNWVMQITYPSTMDDEYSIQARTQSGSIISKAFRGFQYEFLNTTIVDGDNVLTVKGVQTHGLVEGDYIYLYSNINYNPLQGIHKVKTLGIDGNFTKNSVTLDTIIGTPPTGNGNFIRVVEPSFDDINFNNTQLINIITATDISGSTFGSFAVNEDRYVTVNTTIPHNLLINNFVDIRMGTIGTLNGLWKVHNIIGNSGSTKFVIKLDIGINKGTNINFTIPLPQYRIMDGTPSEYYIRNFEVLTSNSYDVYKCAFSTNTYSTNSDTTISIANDTWAFNFNQDINTETIRDNRGGPISEMYYTIIKRSGQNPYNWSHVTSDWDFNYETTTTNAPITAIEFISKNNNSTIGTIEKYSARTDTIDSNGDVQGISGSKYIGDFIEYNREDIKEKTISEVINRFGVQTDPNNEGYYYKPFTKLQLRIYSNIIETAQSDEVIVDIPENYVTYTDNSIAWRDLLTVGYFEEGVNGVDYPFVNGSHYFYFNHNLFIRRQVPPILIDQDDAKISINLNEEC